MFNDKLQYLPIRIQFYQSKLKLLAIFGQSRFPSTVTFFDRRHFYQQTESARAQFIIQGGVILIDLN